MGTWPVAPGPWLALGCAALAYGLGVRALRARRRPWATSRGLAWAAGLLVVAVALVSPLAQADDRFAAHMVQHTLLGMLGPLLLARGAPVSLALRTLRRGPRTALVGLLHARPVAVLAHPVTATALWAGGLVVLYATPLYAASAREPLVHELVHLHVLASGCLVAWVFAGLDPVPQRGGPPLRASALLLALATHAVVAKLLYAGILAPDGVAGPARRAGAQVLYYGGDLVDLGLLVAVGARWYAAGGRELRRARLAGAAPAAPYARAVPPRPDPRPPRP